MSQKPSYVPLLNTLAVGESEAEVWFHAWADVTPDPDVRQVLTTVMVREGEHGKAFAKRLCELGYEFEPSDGKNLANRMEIASSRTLTDAEKFEKLDLTGLTNSPGQEFLTRIFEDRTIDIQTAGLLGRFIAEERDSACLLDACCTAISGASNGSAHDDTSERLDRIERLLETALSGRKR